MKKLIKMASKEGAVTNKASLAKFIEGYKEEDVENYDHFRMGLQVHQKSVKLFTPFSDSDIIIGK